MKVQLIQDRNVWILSGDVPGVFRTYSSEAEAREAEAYLKAKGKLPPLGGAKDA